MTVTLQAADFDAYALLNQRMRAQLAPRAMAGGGVARGVHLAAVYFALPVIVTVGLAVVWGIGPERVADLTAVFVLTWFVNCLAMQLIGWSSERAGLAELREAFEPLVAIPAEVQMDAAGFAVAGQGFSGRYSWFDGGLICEQWPSHVVVLHSRMPLLIPRRDAPADLFGSIISWLEDVAD